MAAAYPSFFSGQSHASGRPIVFFALHNGDDTFMSDKQYEQFYWPTLRKVIMGLIEEGCVPMLFAVEYGVYK